MTELIRNVGYIGLFAIIFAESGLLIGFFLPGDSLLFTAGVMASPTFTLLGDFRLNLAILVPMFFIAAVTGDSVGYMFGRRVGRRLFQREDSFLFKKKNIERAQAFYEKHGGKTIILARFVPVVRTFAPIVAGIGEMKYNRFVSYNVIGGFFWAVGVTLAGYFLGSAIDIDKYLLPIVALIILISVAPAAYHILKEPEGRAEVRKMISGLFNRRPKPVAVEVEESAQD